MRAKSVSNIENTEKTVKRKRKLWSNARCERTKHQRLNACGEEVFNTIRQNIPQCKRAQLSLCLADKMVNYSWKPRNFICSEHLNTDREVFNFSRTSDHCYASRKFINLDCDEDDFNDIDYGEIFDSEGNWRKEHKRAIINVMDCYRISHEAYHELRHAGKGHFPPLHHIRNEKSVMSAEIEYIKHPTVRFLVHWRMQGGASKLVHLHALLDPKN